MMSPEVEPVRKSVVVCTGVERAFALFTTKFDAIKPRDHNLLAVPIAETVFEPRVGGHIYDVGTDGSLCKWARVLAYEPPSRVVFSWDIGPTWPAMWIPATANASAAHANRAANAVVARKGSDMSTFLLAGRVRRVDATTRRPLPLYTHQHGSSFNATPFSVPNQSTLAKIVSETSRQTVGGKLAATAMAS